MLLTTSIKNHLSLKTFFYKNVSMMMVIFIMISKVLRSRSLFALFSDIISIDGSKSYDPDDLYAAITPTWFCSNTGAMDNFTAYENATVFFGTDSSKTNNSLQDVSLQGCYGIGKEVIRLADKGPCCF